MKQRTSILFLNIEFKKKKKKTIKEEEFSFYIYYNLILQIFFYVNLISSSILFLIVVWLLLVWCGCARSFDNCKSMWILLVREAKKQNQELKIKKKN